MTTEDELDEAGLRLVERLNRLMFKVDVESIAEIRPIRKQRDQLRFAEVRWRQRLEDTE